MTKENLALIRVTRTPGKSNALYEAALQPKHGLCMRLLYSAWLVLGIGGLIAFAWLEPVSAWLFNYLIAHGVPAWTIDYISVPLLMVLRAVLLVESFGYAYHRFFQHVGFLTRRSQMIRRNQKYHWIHHMVIYPIGRLYRRAMEYHAAERGISWSWVIPALIVSGLFALSNGINLGTAVFIAAVAWYAKLIVDKTHSRFHEVNHPWTNNRYFQWLEEIHLLHHWDQRTNFTIVHPLMDILFGSYLSPKTHRDELAVALNDNDLTVSDLINWRYLLLEATPAERASFISTAKNHPRSLEKLTCLFHVLNDRLSAHPDDQKAKLLKQRATELLEVMERSDILGCRSGLPEHCV